MFEICSCTRMCPIVISIFPNFLDNLQQKVRCCFTTYKRGALHCEYEKFQEDINNF